jgi:spore germination protein YaaH
MNEGGPFDRILDVAPKDRNARYILVGMGIIGVILLVLVLPPISLLSGGGSNQTPPGLPSNGNGGVRVPRVPEGFEALSQAFSLQKPRGTNGPYAITLNLVQPVSDGRNLGLYTNRDGKWERIGSAALTNNGTAATGEVADIPSNMAVLRRTTSAAEIIGLLPQGAQVDPAALSLLTTITPLDYHPGADGSVLGATTSLPETEANIIPNVRALAPADAEAVNTILASPGLREAHINELVEKALLPGVDGIDIDYRFVNPARKADFTAFVIQLSDRLNQANKTFSLTLPPPVRTGVSWDTGAYDWEELARRADSLRLVPEFDPSIYYERMEGILEFLKTKVEMRKLSLLVNRQSAEKGTDGLRSISLREGLMLASTIEVRTTSAITPNSSVVIVGKNIFMDDGASGLRWDEGAYAVAFSYPGRGGQRTVWLENSLSFAFRLDLARRYGLAGVAIESVSLDPSAPDLWEPLRAYAESGNVKLVAPNSVQLRPTWQIQAGTSEANAKGNIVWKAPPQPGPYDITLIISDGVIRAAQKIVLDVRPANTTSEVAPGATPRP